MPGVATCGYNFALVFRKNKRFKALKEALKMRKLRPHGKKKRTKGKKSGTLSKKQKARKKHGG